MLNQASVNINGISNLITPRLTANAAKFGFCQPYNVKTDRKGYNEEKWHWSFMPLSKFLY